MIQPLAIDLFCGLGGWTDGLLAEGWDVVGFDIERHRYPERDLSAPSGTKVRQSGVDFNHPNVGSSVNRSFNYANEVAVREAPLTGRWIEYPAQLVIQDVLTLHGSQFRDAALIVASPPCQAYSYRAMPWKRARALPPPDNTLFESCFRIQREACEAAGRHIPMVVENVRGAQKWVGRARWNYGSFYLWGDVPALMPITFAGAKVPSFRFDGSGRSFQTARVKRTAVGNGVRFTSRDCGIEAVAEGRKGAGAEWFDQNLCQLPSASPRRKAASAMIAKIPLPLARHIAAVFKDESASIADTSSVEQSADRGQNAGSAEDGDASIPHPFPHPDPKGGPT